MQGERLGCGACEDYLHGDSAEAEVTLTIHLVETWKRDPDFPCEAYEVGPVLANATCETDGHYLCKDCRENAQRRPK